MDTITVFWWSGLRVLLTGAPRHSKALLPDTPMRSACLPLPLVAAFALLAASSASASAWAPREGALPPGLLAGLSMDAKAGDVDGDGDVDLVVAMEWAPVQVLLNDGSGRFAAADFEAASDAVGNGIIAVDVDADGDLDLVAANADGDRLLRNDGAARFTHDRGALPRVDGISQDVIAGDVDGDGDPDLVFGKENGARLLLNDGTGRFALAPSAQWPALADETRKVGLGDVDGDGDLDAYLANTRFSRPQVDAQDRLLVNDGRGGFADATATQLPPDAQNGFHGDLHDLDGDGDLDVLSADVVFGAPQPSPVRALLNDGNGHFSPAPESLWPATIRGPLFDSVALDADGDGRAELLLAMRAAPDLLLGR